MLSECCIQMCVMSYQQIKVGRLSQTFLMEDGPLEIDHRYVKAIEVDMIEVKLASELVVDVRHGLICVVVSTFTRKVFST